MTPTLAIHYLPQFVAEADLAGQTVVVIDLLRASTTICHALAAGAADVTAYLHVDDVRRAASAAVASGVDRDDLVLGGERGGEIIEGFDLGNSPLEYTPDRVFGRRVLFTTTNGTAALGHARLAGRVLVGALVNLGDVVDAIREDTHVHLLCAGTGGHVTREDQLAAGAIAFELLKWGARETSDAVAACIAEWSELCTTARALGRSINQQAALEFRDCPGGRDLLAIGMDADLVACGRVDSIEVVPAYDPATGRITSL